MYSNPACFGVPSVFSVKAVECGACPKRVSCISESKRVLQQINDIELMTVFVALVATSDTKTPASVTLPKPVDVKVPRPSRALWAPDATQKAILDNVPTAVGKMMRGILRREDEVALAMAVGKDPFPRPNQKTASTLYSMLKRGESIFKSQVKQELALALGWAETAASVQASLIWRVFKELGIGVEDGAGKMALSPLINGNTTSLGYRNIKRG